MASGYSKSKVISAYNDVVDNSDDTVDLNFGDLVAIDQEARINDDGPALIDASGVSDKGPAVGVVSGKGGIPAGGGGPVVVAGEAYAYVVTDASVDLEIGAWLDISNTQVTSAAPAGSLCFMKTALATAGAPGDLSGSSQPPIFLKSTRAKLINGTIKAATPGDLASATAVNTLCLVQVFNNPGVLGGS